VRGSLLAAESAAETDEEEEFEFVDMGVVINTPDDKKLQVATF
tara:strand:+ start:94 stop:222 length:129 start_codon:yes stop_codon:yes gene_type:complete